tara:strand:+ start:24307 stop:24969 length:663 start_codon:yes stop_codon:yes gene_type:complete
MSMFEKGSVLPRPFKAPVVQAEEDLTETAFFESVDDNMMLESIERMAVTQDRMAAASACVQWANGGDATADTLDALLYGSAGGVDDEELSDSQMAMYESLQNHASEFILSISGIQEDKLLDFGEDEEAVNHIFESLEAGLENVDSDEAVAEFAVRESMMLEAKKKVIRDGKVTFINTKKRKRRMSAAQKAALKKARAKSRTGASKAARKKSMRQRKSRGM